MIAPAGGKRMTGSSAIARISPADGELSLDTSNQPSPQLMLSHTINRLWAQVAVSSEMTRLLEPALKRMRCVVAAEAVHLWLADPAQRPTGWCLAITDCKPATSVQESLADKDKVLSIAAQGKAMIWSSELSAGTGGICGLPLRVDETVLGVLVIQFGILPSSSVLRALASSADEMARAIQHQRELSRLKSAEQSLCSLSHAVSEAVIVVDLCQRVVNRNQAANCLFDFGSTTDNRFDPRRIAQGADAGVLVRVLDMARSGRIVQHQELSLIRRDGSSMRAALTATLIYRSTGVGDRIQLVVRDVTQIQAAERCGAFLTDSRSVLTRATSTGEATRHLIAAMCRRFGWAAGEFWQLTTGDNYYRRSAYWQAPGVEAEQFFASARPFCREALPPAIRAMWNTPGIWRRPEYGFDKDDSRSALAATAGLHDALILSLGAPGEPAGAAIVGYAFEIPEPDGLVRDSLKTCAFELRQKIELCEAEETIRNIQQSVFQNQKLEMLGVMVSGVAHDFNNLLMVILGSSDLLQQTCGKDHRQLEQLRDIRDAGDRARVLTAQMLAFARQKQRTIANIDLNGVIRDLDRMIRRLVGFEITLEVELAQDLPHIAADPVEIQQLLLNLVVNAHDAMPNGGRLRIATFNRTLTGRDAKACTGVDPGQYVCVAVSDTGCGIEPATARRMFDPFFTTKPQGQGTGLGLALVQNILERCGGQISVDSQVNRGSTFCLYFSPVRDAVSPWVVKEPCRPLPSGTETILLVEEDDVVRSVVRSMLEVRGYEVLEAANGPAAIQVCRMARLRIRLLVCEMHISELSGRELVRQLLRIKPNLPVLYLSAQLEEPTRVKGGDFPVLNKPFTIVSLAQAIRGALDGVHPESGVSVTDSAVLGI